jgi:hypothetical protein
MPYTESEEPKRAKDRIDKVEPRLTKSNTAIELPRRSTPYTDKAAPSRKKLLSDKVEPR